MSSAYTKSFYNDPADNKLREAGIKAYSESVARGRKSHDVNVEANAQARVKAEAALERASKRSK